MDRHQRISLGIQAAGTAAIVGIYFFFAKKNDRRKQVALRMSDRDLDRLIKDIHEQTLVIDNRGEVEENG